MARVGRRQILRCWQGRRRQKKYREEQSERKEYTRQEGGERSLQAGD